MPDITLNFVNSYGIYLFVYLLIPFVFFYNSKINKDKTNCKFDKYSGNQLKGLFIIIVVLHHLSQRMDPGLLLPFHYVGYLSVGVFFYISGFGLIKSSIAKNNYLDNFIYNKFIQIYVPLMLVNAITLFIISTNSNNFSIQDIAIYIISFKLLDETLWFIITICIFYFLFWISFRKNTNIKALLSITFLIFLYVVFCKLIHQPSWRYISSISFIVGIYHAFYEKHLRFLLSTHYYLILLLSVVLFTVAFFLENLGIAWNITVFLSCILFSTSVIILFLKIQPNSRIFNFIGNISLEIYLLHIKIMALFASFTWLNSGIWIFLYFACLIIAASFFHKINLLVQSKLLVKS